MIDNIYLLLNSIDKVNAMDEFLIVTIDKACTHEVYGKRDVEVMLNRRSSKPYFYDILNCCYVWAYIKKKYGFNFSKISDEVRSIMFQKLKQKK